MIGVLKERENDLNLRSKIILLIKKGRGSVYVISLHLSDVQNTGHWHAGVSDQPFLHCQRCCTDHSQELGDLLIGCESAIGASDQYEG